jgi:acetyltransferase
MHPLFYPTSVAVIGVSERPANIARNVVSNLLEFDYQGILSLVGPRGGVFATRRIYRSVLEIPEPVDLAVILTPAAAVPAILEECGQKGIRWAVLETAGFREYSETAGQLEADILHVAASYGIRFIGPNCVGIINMENSLCLPFPPLYRFIEPGGISILSQSGGFGMSVMSLMANEGLGLSKFVSVGNMLNIGAEELLAYLVDDPGTRLIFLYLESIQDGRRLMEIAQRSHKPILAFKANTGGLSRQIAASHTAALSGDDRVVDAAFSQCGIIRVHDETSIVNGFKALQLPPMRGNQLAIVSRSGGHAVVAADACEAAGFKLAHFSDTFIREIESHFRASVIRLTNPLDLGDLFDLDVYAEIIERTLQQPWVDGVVFLHTSSTKTERDRTRELIARLEQAPRRYDKPIALYLTAAADELAYLRKTFAIPIFTQVVETIRALELSHRCYQAQQLQSESDVPQLAVDRAATRAKIDRAQAAGRDPLLDEAMAVLQHYGIPVAQSLRATTVEEAQAAAGRAGYPVALKVISEKISHKSDVGGVRLNLRDADAVAAAYQEMAERIRLERPGAAFDGVLVQPMAADGHELILGGRRDAQFGPVVLVGLGGVFVEILGEAALRVAPLGRRDAQAMIAELRGAAILQGARGRPAADTAAVVEALLRVSQLLCDFPEIRELDVNPLRVFDETQGCLALDARIILQR